MINPYTAASPIALTLGDPLSESGALARAVWRRVLAAYPRAVTRYTEVEVIGGEGYEGIIPAYWRVSLAARINPLAAVAQMLHETDSMAAWWAGKDRPIGRRNPAGIFVTGATRTSPPPAREGDIWQRRGDHWQRGGAWGNWISSPGHPWRPNSVDGHIWRLAGYTFAAFDAERQARYVQACGARPLPWFTRGSAATLRQLGKSHNPMRLLGAGWAAPGTAYGAALAELMNALIREARG
jgi:hypothetical protein